MPRMVKVDADVLEQQLKRIHDAAWASFAQYDRAKRHYIFDEDRWRTCDPYGFDLYDKLRTALR